MRIFDWGSDVCSSDLGQNHLYRFDETIVQSAPQGLQGSDFDVETALGRSADVFDASVWACIHRVILSGYARTGWAGGPQDVSCRSEARRVGKECVSKWRFRCELYINKKKK